MKKQDNQKAIRTLLATISGVGFVTPLTFSNIVEAANFGVGGTTEYKLYDFSAQEVNPADTTKWASGTSPTDVNFHGIQMRIVDYDETNHKVTLWSYETDGTKFASATGVTSDGKVGYGSLSYGMRTNNLYYNSNLRSAMYSSYTAVFGSDSVIQQVTLAEETISLRPQKYEDDDGNTLREYVWAPSKTEVESWTSDAQRAIGVDSWLRSEQRNRMGTYLETAYYVGDSIATSAQGTEYLLRPALQILNQTSCVFTTNVTIPTTGIFIADDTSTGTTTSYALNSSVTATFDPTTGSGVTLDGHKIGITASTSDGTNYEVAGLLTKATSGTDTWANLNGTAANIAYMAQASSDTLDLSGVTDTDDYTLKVFGINTTDNTATELASGAIAGLSKGADGKIHMKIGSTVNAGVPVTIANNAAVDLAGDASNPVTVIETGTATAKKGKLNIGGNTYSGEVINNSGELAVTADANGGVMTGTVSGSGKLIVESGKLIYTGRSIENDVEIKAGATLDPDAGVFPTGTTVTNYGTLEITGGTLNATIDGQGGDNLLMKGQMEIGAGSVKQVAGSNVTVAASMIEADTNDAGRAMFTGVTATGQLDVSNGNLTLTGLVYENKYYVLLAGGAVGVTVTASDLWKVDNVKFPGVLLAEYDTNVTGNSIALKMTKVATFEEGNTSGMAAVQQGNISVAKELTDEVANRLSLVQRPSLLQKIQAKIRNVASTAEDKYNIETVEQGNANEVMPVQVVEKDEYDKTVWASYIRTKETTEGMNLGAGLKGDNTAQYNGTVVGVDFYSSKKAIAGMALSYTTGDIDSYSGTTSTRNKSKYYGVSFYDRVTNGNIALIYDVGFIHGDNEISQFYTGKETTSDVKTNTYTAGARWEAEIETGRSKIVPFASFRYMRVNNGDYTNSHGTKFETKNQNLYIPKVGIAWTGDFIMPKSVWTWRPSVEAGYVWNLGDRTADSNVLMGTRPAAIEYDTVDKSSYYTKLGMEFMCKNFTAGLFYRYLKGDKVRNNKWNVNVSWSF